MKSASPELLALLATRQFYSADLYLFTLYGGGTLNYCGGDQDVLWDSARWACARNGAPALDRKDNKAKCHWKVGVEVDTLVFDAIPGAATVLGQPFLSAVRQGVFDGAELTLYRAFMPTYGDTAAGTVIMFAGRVAEVDCGRSLATFSINSHLELLNQNLPRNLYQAGCVNTLYDSACTLNQASFAVSGTVLVASTTQITTTLGQPAGYFDLGTVTLTSGANAGISRTVKNWSSTPSASFHLISPFPVIASPGDAFLAYPGCHKTQAECAIKFNNLSNFRGFPFVPANETSA